ncbi:MAG: hypothetical protein ACF8LL_02345 [Phycisphaerales bacterium]
MQSIVAILTCAGMALGADLDDFESYAPGAFPAPFWQDAGLLHPDEPNPPIPSMVVIETTDAFGAPTQAVQFVEAIGETQGIYHAAMPIERVVISANVRIDQYCDMPFTEVSDWPIEIGIAQFSEEFPDLCCAPQIGLYVSSLEQEWRLYAIGDESGFSEIDFDVPAPVGVWFTVELTIDTIAGQVTSRLWDTASGTPVLDRTDALGTWTPNDGPFQLITCFDSDLAPENTIANLATVDDFEFRLACQADCNGDGQLNILDFVCFQGLFVQGCP